MDVESVRRQRRPLLRFCVDWSEQRHHLGGALGAAVLTRRESAGWVRQQSSSRSLRMTDSGVRVLDRVLGVELAA
ncbi:hypothetical protein [Nocardia sp. NPDC051570]|uniref:hypothetical protein n=1 Tax=Nocardia sp. NPDC051570 TaxID=3364324 RepID=UPI0037B130B6